MVTSQELLGRTLALTPGLDDQPKIIEARPREGALSDWGPGRGAQSEPKLQRRPGMRGKGRRSLNLPGLEKVGTSVQPPLADAITP